MKRFVAVFVLPLAIIAGAVLFAGYLRATRAPVEPQASQERVWPVRAVAAVPSDARPTFTAFGTIVAGRELDLRPQIAGRLVRLGAMLVEGGIVRRGDLLAEIEAFDYEVDLAEREAKLAEARAKVREYESERNAELQMLQDDKRQVAIAERDVKRRESLHKSSAGSEKALDDARLSLSQRRQAVVSRGQAAERLAARIEQQVAVVAQLEAQVARARRDLERTRITAPFDGFVYDVAAAVGTQVTVSDRMARLIDAEWLDVRFHLSAGEYARLVAGGAYRGKPVEVIWRLGGEVRRFAASIERVDSEIDTTTGGVRIFARLAGTGTDGLLRPGAFVEVRVPDRAYSGVVHLPEAAVHNGTLVYVIEDERLRPLAVETVARDRDGIWVRGAFADGAEVVTTRFAEMGPGVKVVIR